MRIVFMGTPDFAAVILKGLIEAGHDIALCVTQPDKQKGRGKKVQYSPVKEVALEHGIRVIQPERVRGDKEFLDELNKAEPDISVVAAYGQILPVEVLEAPGFGSVNVHASLLPKLRGASPIQHAILEGDEETGVTIMQMGPGLDTGDMISKVKVKIGDSNFSELHDKLAEAGSELLIRTLRDIEDGKASFEKQDDSLSSYAPMIGKQDGHIDFTKDPSEIINKIRAFDPWPGAFAYFGENDDAMKFWKAEPSDKETAASDAGRIIAVDADSFTVGCGGKALKVTEIQVPGKRRMSTSDYLRGHSIEKGLIFR
ncbi:MAG: methionyl-tRNA formyltransferase [Firmicutes bacterium]|nr:methionyl-tRNA formyltransferase [Bacillota bacterium]